MHSYLTPGGTLAPKGTTMRQRYFVPKGKHFIFNATVLPRKGHPSATHQIPANSFDEAATKLQYDLLQPGQTATMCGRQFSKQVRITPPHNRQHKVVIRRKAKGVK